VIKSTSRVKRSRARGEPRPRLGHGLHGLAGRARTHLQSFNNRAPTTSRAPTGDHNADVEAVVCRARGRSRCPPTEICTWSPQGFALDRQRGVPHRWAWKLAVEVDVHIVTASSAHLNNVLKTVAQAGFEVVEPVYACSPRRAARVSEEKELGSVLIDWAASPSPWASTARAPSSTQGAPLGSDSSRRPRGGLKTSIRPRSA